MANKKFTEEEMNHLRASSYVSDVSPSIVHFSVAFKKKFWDSIQAGKTPREIVVELGIDPDILGELKLGYGSSIAVTIVVLSTSITVLLKKLLFLQEYDGGGKSR